MAPTYTTYKAGVFVPVSQEFLADLDLSTATGFTLTRRERVRFWLQDQSDRFAAAWRAFRDPYGWDD